MSNRQVFYFLLLVLFAVFLLSITWEFMLEDTLGAYLGIDIAEEPAKEKLVYVFGSVFFAGVAVIGPILLLQKSANARKRAEKLLPSAVENLQECFALFDADDRLIMCNERYRQTHPLGAEFLKPGIKFEDIVRANIRKGNLPDAVGREEEYFRERMERHLNPGKAFVRRYANGRSYLFNEAVTPDGGICVTMTDVTEIKEAEEKIRKLNAQLEARVDQRTQDLYEANRANSLLQKIAAAANEAATVEDALQVCLDEVCDFTGWPVGHAFKVTGPDRIDSMKIWHLDDPEKFAVFRKVTDGAHFVSGGLSGKALATGQPYWIKDVGQDKSFQRGQLAADLGVKAGFSFPVLIGKEVVAVLEFYSMEAADPDQALLDVMAQAGTQLGRVVERERADGAVRDSEQRAQRILDNLADGAITITAEGMIDYVNPQTERIFGYSEDELIGRNVSMLMPEPNRGEHGRYLDNYLKTGKANIIGIGREVTGLRKDGTTFPLDLSISETKVGGQTIFTGTVRDISEHKKAQRELITAKQDAEAANRAKSEFLANMSHELRTPLNAIIGFSEMTRSQDFGPVGNPKYLEYAADINQSGNHLLDLINDILDLSAIEAEKLELRTEPVGLATQVTVAEQFLSRKASDGGVRIINTVGMDTPLIMADKLRVKQILINLLSNAVKFTSQGGRVTMSAGLDADGCMAIVIADTGIGMDEAGIAEAREPFGQADSKLSRKYEGTGLGLPLSKSLTEAHGGALEIESSPGKGTTVTVRFPADRVIIDPAAVEGPRGEVLAARKPH